MDYSRHVVDVKMEKPNFLDWFYCEESLVSEIDGVSPPIGLLDTSTTDPFHNLSTSAGSRSDGLCEVDFDLSYWDDDRIIPIVEDATKTNESSNSKASTDEGEKRGEGEKWEGGAKSRCSSLGFEEISRHFYVPITQAAKDMKVSLTVLKKRCRELGISRWPHRKMKSLNSLIHNIQEMERNGGDTEGLKLKGKIERLEEHRRLMEKRPEMQLTEETKKLRQTYFKANYKKRRTICTSRFD